ncbi:sensor histidine kinase [Streptomyces boncukensis]|uniref:histidine kinase n=1 Tax=Streptomyces boncukensis TaxID=2711219 RepID=A0A6G4WS00_9ACTN|nr:histidine kinase [Streptomyces boncukensis]NGO67407.1 two-component sensor histidine kinase [Streptomyces boncukensis]
MPARLTRPHRDDVLVAVCGLAGGLLLWAFGLYNSPALVGARWLPLLPLAVMCLLVLGRRTAQPWVLVAAVPVEAADMLTGGILATLILFTDIVYAAVLYGSPRLGRILLPGTVVFTVAVTFGLLAVSRDPQVLLVGALTGGITMVPAWTGALVRQHKDRASAERLRAEQTALLAEMDRAQAINAERSRMARELHDVVANHLSAIAIHSTAALSLDDGGGDGAGDGGGDNGVGAARRDALGVIRENSVQGLAEMRRLIGLLRDASGDAEPAATPSLNGLEALLARARGDGEGLAFTLRDARADGAALPAPVELAAYRVVQEAVTNALKHAAPGTVEVALATGGDVLRIRVTSPLADRDGPRVPGSGAGLVGMRERVELLRGELTAGPVTGAHGGKVWEVCAVLPARAEARSDREESR